MAKLPADLRSLARAHTAMGIKVLAGIAENGTSDAARVSAVALLFERGWGKPPQPQTGADGEGNIRVTIRHIVEGRDAPRVIEQQRVVEHVPTDNVPDDTGEP
jgi:hypothetical protein